MGWIARKRKRSQRFYTIPDRDEGVSFSEKVAMGIMVFVAFGAVVALYVGKVPLGVLLLLRVVFSGLSVPLADNVGGLFLSISHDDRRQQLRIGLSAMGVYLHGVIACRNLSSRKWLDTIVTILKPVRGSDNQTRCAM